MVHMRAVPRAHVRTRERLMTRILFLGYDPETVDFSDPALPPGMSAEKVHAGIAVAMKGFAERGWEADVCFIRPDETAGPTVEDQLGSTSYDCVVIGAGVRLPPKRIAIFASVINAVRKAAPGATIAFNTLPENSADAAARWLRNCRYQALTLRTPQSAIWRFFTNCPRDVRLPAMLCER